MTTTEDRELTRRRLRALTASSPAEASSAAPSPADPAEGRVPDWLEAEPQESPSKSWLPERLRTARLDPGRRGTLALAGLGAVIAIVAAALVIRQTPERGPVPAVMPVSSAAASSTVVPTEIVVSVVGLVLDPGLVKLKPGARVADAIEVAGGAARGADLVALNLAQRLNDGDQVVVGSASGGSNPSTVLSAGGSSGSGGQGAKVNLNTATEAELDGLPGVGPVTAASIVEYRKKNGRFDSVDQLAQIEGIGPSRLSKLRDLVTV